MSYFIVKIENNRFKNPLAKLKRKNLDEYWGSLSKRRANTNDYDDNSCLLFKTQENYSFDVADVEVDDFIEFRFIDFNNVPHVQYVRVHWIKDKEICFGTYINRISWRLHQDQLYY